MAGANPSTAGLRRLEFFADMPLEHLRLVARLAKVRRCRAGETVIAENTPADTFYIIRSGRVAISKQLATGEQIRLGEESSGGFFGEMALLDEGPRSATARALTACSLLEISRSDFRVLLDQAPLLAYAMMRVLSSRLRGSEAKMVSELKQANEELKEAYLDTINAMVNALEARDPYTRGHTERVTLLATSIARQLKLSSGELYAIELGARLHDVGKIGVPDAILLKPGPLNGEEYEKIQEHPAKGRNILRNIAYLKKAIPGVLFHHEHFDGRGYPQRLSYARIPLLGRIISVADAFDAMTTDRPYRRRLSDSQALAELRRCAGRQFDPRVVGAFQRVWRGGQLGLQLARMRKG